MQQVQDRNTFKKETHKIDGKLYGYSNEMLKITVQYGFRKIGKQTPYFSITGDICKLTGRDKDVMCGCIHDEIREHFPHLAPLIHWHLTDQNGVPMYYIENTLFHFQEGKYDYAKSNAVWGTVITDKVLDIEDFIDDVEGFKKYLEMRLPDLQNSFNHTMDTFQIERIHE